MASSAPLNTATATVLGLASFGIATVPKPSNTWWHHKRMPTGAQRRQSRTSARARRPTRPLLRLR